MYEQTHHTDRLRFERYRLIHEVNRVRVALDERYESPMPGTTEHDLLRAENESQWELALVEQELVDAGYPPEELEPEDWALEREQCNACSEMFVYHHRYRSNGYPHCPDCLGVAGVDPETIEEGAFD